MSERVEIRECNATILNRIVCNAIGISSMAECGVLRSILDEVFYQRGGFYITLYNENSNDDDFEEVARVISRRFGCEIGFIYHTMCDEFKAIPPRPMAWEVENKLKLKEVI